MSLYSACLIRLGSERKLAFKTYAETQAAFDDTSAFTEIKKYLEVSRACVCVYTVDTSVGLLWLQSQLEEICKQRTEENYQAYIREVIKPY